jgi:uncharacterized phiE125 gp8 family phage protein
MYESGTYKVITGPTSEPLTLSDVKAWLKVDDSADDTLITLLISAARESAEKYLQMALLPQTIEEYYDGFYPYGLRLSITPIISLTHIYYTPPGGTSTLLDTSFYTLHPSEKPPLVLRIENMTFPEVTIQGAGVKVTYQAGFANAAAVPAAIKLGMLKTIAESYANRQDSVFVLPTAAMHLFDKYRINYFR